MATPASAILDPHPEAPRDLSVAELHAGVREGAERHALDTLISTFSLIDLSAEIAAQGGLLRRDWGKSHGVDLNDALITATTTHAERVLLSLKAKHFPMLGKGRLVVACTKP